MADGNSGRSSGPMIAIGIAGLVVGVVIGAFVLGGGSEPEGEAQAPAEASGEDAIGPTVRWKMASAFPGELVQLGDQGQLLEERVRVLSGGTVELKFFEPGALVPPFEIFDAVSNNSIDAGWSAAGYWAGKIPAAQFFTAVPFGPSAGEALAWVFYGGGQELFEELYRPHNIHPMPCNLLSPEGSGWFSNPIESIDDLKGLKMRFFGLGAKVIEKLGVSTQLLAGGDIFPALELGTIDATEFRCRPSISISAFIRWQSIIISPDGISRSAWASSSSISTIGTA